MTHPHAQSDPRQRIRRILVANRGEIACRVIRTCRELAIETVAVYSEADSHSHAPWTKLATQAVFIGPSAPNLSYLSIDRLVKVALDFGCDAVHPGYGFLSENPDFARSCAANGIKFIGPQPESIEAIGDKISAKVLLRSEAPEVPLIPGYDGKDQSVDRLVAEANRIGYPVLLKASAGGGGKGMRIVRSPKGIQDEVDSAKGEAFRSFGNDKLLIEKYFEFVKHIEIQIVGDQYGNIYHCFERECSVQRRHQKVIEETPSPALSQEVRSRMTDAAVRIGQLLKYEGVGTVEFIFDTRDGSFYFLEVNTRLQVEHPITEAITGLDLVALQIQVANGESLADSGLSQMAINGHAVECRLYAEDPNNSFFPCTGKVLLWKSAQTKFTNGMWNPRFDTGIETGSEISVFYDPLVSKITTWGPTRAGALSLMMHTLHSTACLGLITNKEFLLRILSESRFTDGSYTTRLIEGMSSLRMEARAIPVDPAVDELLSQMDQAPHRLYVAEKGSPIPPVETSTEASIVAALWWAAERKGLRTSTWNRIGAGWRSGGVRWSAQACKTDVFNTGLQLEYVDLSPSFGGASNVYAFRTINADSKTATRWFRVELNDLVSNSDASAGNVVATIGTTRRQYAVAAGKQALFMHCEMWPLQISVSKRNLLASAGDSEDAASSYTSTMPCRILKLMTPSGSTVAKDQAVLTLESMKMETKIYARHNGRIKYLVSEGQVIEAGTLMLEIE